MLFTWSPQLKSVRAKHFDDLNVAVGSSYTCSIFRSGALGRGVFYSGFFYFVVVGKLLELFSADVCGVALQDRAFNKGGTREVSWPVSLLH